MEKGKPLNLIIMKEQNINDTYQIPTSISNSIMRKRNWFPIRVQDELALETAYLIGKIMGDGHLDKNFIVKFHGRKEDLVSLSSVIHQKFHIPINKMFIKKKKAWGICYGLTVSDAVFGRLLYALGAPRGNKTKTKFLVPQWIFLSQKTQRLFLQGLFEDELTTIKIEKASYSVKPQLKMAKTKKLLPNLRNFLNQIRNILKNFEIEYGHVSNPKRKKYQKTYDLYFYIQRNKRNIVKFKENIGFRLNQRKAKELENCYNILKQNI